MLGTGTVSDPYLISTPADLQAIIEGTPNIYYELANDIDMTGVNNWIPLGTSSGFRGNLDGKGYKIKNLTINRESIYPSIFGQCFYGTIQNVGVENPQYNLSVANPQRFVGALIGYAYGVTIKNCYSTGGQVKGDYETGGLLGKIWDCDVSDCYNNTEVIIASSTYYGGGLFGSIDSDSNITNCYNSGKVTYSYPANPYYGKAGFVGFVRNNTSIVFNNCYWDKETSGHANLPITNDGGFTVTGITGKTTSEMKTQSTYTGFDFTNTWLIQSDYPLLQVFGIPALPPQLITINVMSTMNPIGATISRKAKTVKELTSYVNTILSDSKRSAKVFKNVEGYLSPFDSNATQSHRTVRSSRQDVVSYMSPIYSYANRESKTVKHLLATMKPFEGSVNVIIPMNTKGAYAYVEVIQNPSSVSTIGSRSYSEYIQNPSNVEVI